MDHINFARALTQRLLPCRPCLAALTRPGASRSGLRRALTAAGGALATGGLVGLSASALPPLPPTGPLFSGAAGPGRSLAQRPSDFGHPARRWTDVLLAANVLLFGAQLLTREMVTVWGVKVNQLIVAGQWWRLLTPTFLHGSLVHLVVNSMSLNNLGPVVEGTTGHQRFLAIYLAAGLAGNVASFLGSPSPSLGASGAIFGVGGALAVFFYRNRNLFGRRSDAVLRQLWQTLLINITYGLMSPRIDNWGHLGGMLGGALVAYLLGPALDVRTLPGRRGKWLVDEPPIGLFANPPRKLD